MFSFSCPYAGSGIDLLLAHCAIGRPVEDPPQGAQPRPGHRLEEDVTPFSNLIPQLYCCRPRYLSSSASSRAATKCSWHIALLASLINVRFLFSSCCRRLLAVDLGDALPQSTTPVFKSYLGTLVAFGNRVRYRSEEGEGRHQCDGRSERCYCWFVVRVPRTRSGRYSRSVAVALCPSISVVAYFWVLIITAVVAFLFLDLPGVGSGAWRS